MSGRTAAAGGAAEFWPALGHHAWKAPFLANGILVAALFLPPGGWWFWPFLVLVFGIFGVAGYATVRHNHTLCERCISEMPLNPQELVERKNRQLRWDHKEDRWAGGSRWKLAVVIFAPIAVIAVMLLVLPKNASAVVAVLWLGVFQTYEILATRIHKILQPWCPYCHRDPGGGDGQFSPEPAPLPTEKAAR